MRRVCGRWKVYLKNKMMGTVKACSHKSAKIKAILKTGTSYKLKIKRPKR